MPSAPGTGVLESKLLHLLCVEQMQWDPGAPAGTDSGLITQRVGEAPLCSLCSLTKVYWINAVFKRLLSVFPREASSSHSSFFVAYRSSRRISRFTISLSHSWGCSFSISVFMLPGWKMRNKYIGTPEQKNPWDGSSAQVWCLTVVVIRGAVLSDITSDAGQDSGWLLWLSLTFWKASVSECLNGALSALQGARCFLMCHLLDCWATCPVILSY